jgi:hypothetical protein
MTTNENNELEDVVDLDHEQQDELDEVRFGPTPVPTDFNRTEKPQAILSRSIITCCMYIYVLDFPQPVLIMPLFPYTSQFE